MDDANQISELKRQIEELKLKLDRALNASFVNKEHEKIKADLIKARQEAEAANRSKTMFLANMSHEIRTPMNSIIGIYNVLNQTELTEEQKEFLEIIHISSQNLLAIINDILDLSKIEAGQLKLETKPFFLHEEIQQVIKLLSIKAKGKGVELYSKIQSTVPSCIIGDPVRLKQILINLTNNALKFTNEGHVSVSVETMKPSEMDINSRNEFLPDEFLTEEIIHPDLLALKFEITDTGIGISHEEQKNLFYEYAQLENPLIQKFEGTGLGLSISKNLTSLMKGKIGVQSDKGKGSTFWFTIPLLKGNEEVLLSQRRATNPKTKKTRPLSILLVEDNLLNQKFAVTSLQRIGHMVEVAENGKLALEKYIKNRHELILMDIAMPIMDGIEATHRIREWEATPEAKNEAGVLKKTKIVAITAHVMVNDREKCLASGMDEYLAKPYRPQELVSIIDNLDIY